MNHLAKRADGKKPKKLDINKVDENTARGIHEARGQEWGQVPAVQRGRSHHGTNAGLLESLLREGHVPIPSQWVDVDKNEFKKGRSDKSIGVVRKLRGCFPG